VSTVPKVGVLVSGTFANWQTAQSILTARFVKFCVQIAY
jgi:hypothetical protein